tara:strand:+ start:1714 stop:2034 length:321 start_codon:yes stop_codon:yes gene_type:complete
MPASRPSPVSECDAGVRLAVRLSPGAKSNKLEGAETDAAGSVWLRVQVSAPPVDGQANAALVKLLAKRWRLPKSAICIVSGASARNKILRLEGDTATLRSQIEADL